MNRKILRYVYGLTVVCIVCSGCGQKHVTSDTVELNTEAAIQQSDVQWVDFLTAKPEELIEAKQFYISGDRIQNVEIVSYRKLDGNVTKEALGNENAFEVEAIEPGNILRDNVSFAENGIYEVILEDMNTNTFFAIHVLVDGEKPGLKVHETEEIVTTGNYDVQTSEIETVSENLREFWQFDLNDYMQDNLEVDKEHSSYELTAVSAGLGEEFYTEYYDVSYHITDICGNGADEVMRLKIIYQDIPMQQAADTENTEEENSTKKEKKNTEKEQKQEDNKISDEEKYADEPWILWYMQELGCTEEEARAFFSGIDDESYTDDELYMDDEPYWEESSILQPYYDSDFAQQAYELVNEARLSNGLQPLAWDSNMASYSDRRAAEIVGNFTHDSPGGNWNVAENIAMGYLTPEMVMEGWMNSDGHRNNILNADYTKISISCYCNGITYYWVQNFAY